MTELEEKTKRLVAMLVREGLDAVILNAQHNFAWLTAGGSNGVDLSRENGVASLLVRKDGKRFIFASNIEMPRMLAEVVSADDFEPIEYRWQDEKASSAFVIDKAKGLLGGGELATDYAIENKVAACRHQLTPDEIERYRTLGRDAGAAVQKVIGKISVDQTELEIAEKIRLTLARDNMTSVVTLVAADERISQFRHPLPTVNRWNKTLLVVTCAKRHGLIVSLSRMVSVGEPSDELKRKTEAAALVNASLLDATRPGVTGAELYSVAATAYAATGFADEIDKHHQGGAAGYRTRDWVAHPMNNEIVTADQAFAWNPSITGTKVEETAICREDGIEIITTADGVPTIETVVGGRTYYSPGIIVL